jgi:hypothetical protein
MSKVIGTPLAVEPSLLLSAAVDPSTRSPSNSASVNRRSMPGSTGPEASDWIE